MRHVVTNTRERPFLGVMALACVVMSLLAIAAADPTWIEFEAADGISGSVAYDITAPAQTGSHVLAAVVK